VIEELYDSIMKTLDIVTSAKNESQNIQILVDEVCAIMEFENYLWRLIIVENGSSDGTWEMVTKMARENPKILGVKLSRDFGFDSAISAGLQLASADAIIMMASDLQDSPEFIPSFLRKYEEGFDHVYQVVSARPGVSVLRNFNSRLFYFIAGKFSKGLIKSNSSTFRLISQNVNVGLEGLDERNRFLRAIIPWVGFKSIGISLPRRERIHGVSKARSRATFRYAFKGILANSYSLLDVVGFFGIVTSISSLILTFVSSVIWISHGVPFAGFGTIVGLISLGFGLIFLCLGIIAQYLSLVYEEVKGRPNYIISGTTERI
jgi:glycosyltransferase involved in cell wall biosynthesis